MQQPYFLNAGGNVNTPMKNGIYLKFADSNAIIRSISTQSGQNVIIESIYKGTTTGLSISEGTTETGVVIDADPNTYVRIISDDPQLLPAIRVLRIGGTLSEFLVIGRGDEVKLPIVLDVSECANLSKFYIEDKENTDIIQQFYAQGCTSLSNLVLPNATSLSVCNLSGCASLSVCDLRNSPLKTLNISDCVSLELSNLKLNTSSALTSLDISGTMFDESIFDDIISYYSKITVLNMHSMPNMRKVDATKLATLLQLDAHNCANLNTLIIPKSVTTCNIAGCTKLAQLRSKARNLVALDLSGDIYLRMIDVFNTANENVSNSIAIAIQSALSQGIFNYSDESTTQTYLSIVTDACSENAWTVTHS